MRLAAIVRVTPILHECEPTPSIVMIDAQTVRGAHYGPTFDQAGGPGGRTVGTKRTLLVEVLGLPVAARADPARPHDVHAGRELLRERLDELPRLSAVVGDRAYRGLAALAQRRRVNLTSRRHHAARPASRRCGRSTRSSTRSPSWGAGAASRAATRDRRRVPGPGSRWPRSAISPGARSPDRSAPSPSARPRSLPIGGGPAQTPPVVRGDLPATPGRSRRHLPAIRIIRVRA